MNAYSIFIRNKHVYRKNKSCTTQLLEFIYDDRNALDKRLSVDWIFLNFRKAFDTVSQSFLVEKFYSYNIITRGIAWIV